MSGANNGTVHILEWYQIVVGVKWINNDWLLACLVGWFVGGLIDWLIGWSIDWWIDWLTACLLGWLVCWWIDWLTDWLIYWLIDWLIDWLSDCLLACLVGWFVGGLVDWLIGWFIDWLIDWSIDWLSDCLLAWLAGLLVDWLTDWLVDLLTDRLIDWLINWLIVWLVDWLSDCLLALLVGLLVDWLIDWLIDWLVGWLVDWVTNWLIGWLVGGWVGCLFVWLMVYWGMCPTVWHTISLQAPTFKCWACLITGQSCTNVLVYFSELLIFMGKVHSNRNLPRKQLNLQLLPFLTETKPYGNYLPELRLYFSNDRYRFDPSPKCDYFFLQIRSLYLLWKGCPARSNQEQYKTLQWPKRYCLAECVLFLTLSLPRVINVKFPLQPPQVEHLGKILPDLGKILFSTNLGKNLGKILPRFRPVYSCQDLAKVLPRFVRNKILARSNIQGWARFTFLPGCLAFIFGRFCLKVRAD